MANRERGELRLAAPDRVYLLRLTPASCCEMEHRSGQTLADLVTGCNAMQATALRWLLWAGLQDQHSALFLEPEAVGRLADRLGGLLALRSVVVDLVHANEDDSPPEPAQRGPATPAEPGSRWRRLYIDARRAGIEPDQFWRLSLLELWRELASQRELRRQAIERDRTLAWMTAALSRAKTLPSLDSFIGRKPVEQTPDEMRGMLAVLKAMYPKTRHQKGKACRTVTTSH